MILSLVTLLKTILRIFSSAPESAFLSLRAWNLTNFQRQTRLQIKTSTAGPTAEPVRVNLVRKREKKYVIFCFIAEDQIKWFRLWSSAPPSLVLKVLTWAQYWYDPYDSSQTGLWVDRWENDWIIFTPQHRIMWRDNSDLPETGTPLMTVRRRNGP